MSHPSIESVSNRYKALEASVRAGVMTLPNAVSSYAWVRKDGKSLAVAKLNAAMPQSVSTDEKYAIPFVVSTQDEDRDGDVVASMGCILDDYALNPCIYFGHQETPIPIAKAMSPAGKLMVFPEERRVLSTAYFDEHDEDAMFIHGKILRGFLSAASVAFVPVEAWKRDDVYKAHHNEQGGAGWHYARWKMTEWSVVGVPSAAAAVAIRDAMDKEKSFIRPRLYKALGAYAAVTKGCWNGWCPTCPPQEKANTAPNTWKVRGKADGKWYVVDRNNSIVERLPNNIDGFTTKEEAQAALDKALGKSFDQGKTMPKKDHKHCCTTKGPCGCAVKRKALSQADMEAADGAGMQDLTKGLDELPKCPRCRGLNKINVPGLGVTWCPRCSGTGRDVTGLPKNERDALVEEYHGKPFRDVGTGKSMKRKAYRIVSDDNTDDGKPYFMVVGDDGYPVDETGKHSEESFYFNRAAAEAAKRKLEQQKSAPRFIRVNGVQYKSTSSDVTSPTSTETSTEAYTAGNFTATVTGGAGDGDTVVHIYPAAEDEDEEDEEKVGTSSVGLMKMSKFITINGKRYKALNESTGAAGGYTVPEERKDMDTQYDQGYVAAHEGRGQSTNPYKNSAEDVDAAEDWAAGWRDGAKDKLQLGSNMKSHRDAKRLQTKALQWKKYGNNWSTTDEVYEIIETSKKDIYALEADYGQTEIFRGSLEDCKRQAEHHARGPGHGAIGNKSHRCTFCKGTGNGCGSRGDCPDCGGRGVIKVKARVKNMRRKDLTDETLSAEDRAIVPIAGQEIAHLYSHAKSESDWVQEQLGSMKAFDADTGEPNKMKAALQEYNDEHLSKRMEHIKEMYSQHAPDGDLDKALGDMAEADKGMLTDGTQEIETGEANMTQGGGVVEMEEEEPVVEADLDEEEKEAAYEDCTQCDGEGTLPDGNTCPSCQGQGSVEKDETEVEEKQPDKRNTDPDTEEILERYQTAKGYRSRPATTSRVAKVLRAGGRVKKGQDGRRWLVAKADQATQLFDKLRAGQRIKVTMQQLEQMEASDDPDVLRLATTGDEVSGYTAFLKSLRRGKRKDLTNDGNPTEQKELAPEHAEAVKTTGNMLKGLAAAHDMPEHHKSALDMHGDAIGKALGGDGDVGEAVKAAHKHMKSLADAPDVPDHHQEALGHHAKAMAKAMKELGAGEEEKEEEPTVEADETAVEEKASGSPKVECVDCGWKGTESQTTNGNCPKCKGEHIAEIEEDWREDRFGKALDDEGNPVETKAEEATPEEQKLAMKKLAELGARFKTVNKRVLNGVKK